jgi:hypothetical protein
MRTDARRNQSQKCGCGSTTSKYLFEFRTRNPTLPVMQGVNIRREPRVRASLSLWAQHGHSDRSGLEGKGPHGIEGR